MSEKQAVEIHEASDESSLDSVPLGAQKKTWRGRIWDSFDYGSEERLLLLKLDCTILFLGATGVFLRYLDQTNINNAFVSGMKEDLGMYGNELNYANACWSVGYVVGQLVASVLLTRFKAHYVLGFIEVVWAVITFASSSVRNTTDLYVARLFLGLIEGGHFPGIMYLTASWYRKNELGKRSAIIQFCTGAGPMFSGYLQAAAYDGLNGVSGRAGWRWLFIVDGIISLPLALATVVALPDVPRQQDPNWLLSEREVELARRRVPDEVKVHVTYKWRDVKRWFTTWHIYGFSVLFTAGSIAGQANSSMPFWFKSYVGEYTVSQINTYPTPQYAVQIVSTVFYAYLADHVLKGRRWIIVAGVSFALFPIYLSLAVTPVHPSNRAGRWVLYYLCGLFGGLYGQLWAWINEILAGDPLKRSFVSTFMNALSYAFTAWVPILLFPTQDQPYVKKGNIASSVLVVFTGLIGLLLAYIQSLERDRGFFKSVGFDKDVEHFDDKEETLLE